MAKRIEKPVLMTNKTNQVIDKAFIVKMLNENDAWLYRAVVSIYEWQTADEQNAEVTAHDNGVGFNSVDATILSSFAKQITSRNFLTPKQKEIARKKMNKYASQLLRIALSKVTAHAAI